MSLTGRQATLSRLRENHAAWRLLAADSAPLILAALAELFAELTEVPFSQARLQLDLELARLREAGNNVQLSASHYLREWTNKGWLREQDEQLTLTDAADVALRFARGLDQRIESATASHLRIVQDAVRDLALALSPDAELRIQALNNQRTALDAELAKLQTGMVSTLAAGEQRERLREVYQLASMLTGDFRRLEDDIRQLDRQLRVDMIQADNSRGAVLQKLLEQENALAQTEAGRAFEGFFQLLADNRRTTEFREQLRAILELAESNSLAPSQQQFLLRLVRELGRESDRVLQVRRRAEESLRAYIESVEFQEHRAVARLLAQLEQGAIALRDAAVSPRTPLQLSLDSGRAELGSVDSFRLRLPNEVLNVDNIQANPTATTASETVLNHLETVKVMEVAHAMHKLLREHGNLSLGQIMQHRPITGGLEELVAHLRVAQAVEAPQQAQQEHVTITAPNGDNLSAHIPAYVLSAAMFPAQLDELPL